MLENRAAGKLYSPEHTSCRLEEMPMTFQTTKEYPEIDY